MAICTILSKNNREMLAPTHKGAGCLYSPSYRKGVFLAVYTSPDQHQKTNSHHRMVMNLRINFDLTFGRCLCNRFSRTFVGVRHK